MKRLIATLFIIMLCVFPTFASAESSLFDGFTGIFEKVSGIKPEISENTLSPVDANKIIKSIFGQTPFKGEKVLNSDLARYLSTKVSGTQIKPPFKFKDAGLLAKDLRKYYSLLNAEDKIYSADGFLNPDDELTYSHLFGSLSMFEKEILKTKNIKTVSGSVNYVSLENDTTTINMNTSNGVENVKITNIEKINVFEIDKIAPYSRNIKRGDEIVIYTDKKGNGIYIKKCGEYFDEFENLKDKYDLFRGDIYYIDQDMAIVKNIAKFNGYTYDEVSKAGDFSLDQNAIFNHNFKPVSTEHINENLLDKKVHIICDKSNNAKYFNISE